ncbi:hypothetical protein D3C78_988940 [compost metagenome]
MKAERDDAPHYLRNRKSDRWRFLAILGIGSAATWAAIFMFAKPITIDVNQLQKAITVGDQDAARQQSREDEKARALAKFLAEQQNAPHHQPAPGMHAYRPAPPAEPQHRQTVFNDQNYRPRTDINTIEGVKLGIVGQPQKQPITTPKPQKNHVIDSWQWDTGAGMLSWEEVDGKIDFNMICAQEKYGSFRYRDCRKAAKDTFKRRCGQGDKASCHAVNQYRPLG